MKLLVNQDYADRAISMTKVSFSINAVIGVGKLLLGVYLLSLWFIMNAVYYLVLCFARGRSIRKYTSAKTIVDHKDRYDWEFTVFRRSGTPLCLLGGAYFLICTKMYFHGDATIYPGSIVYLVAFISFIKLGLAISGTITTRHLKSPIVRAQKIINFADAMVSIVVTQCALLTYQEATHAVINSALFGMAVSVVFLVVGVGMLTRRQKVVDIDIA